MQRGTILIGWCRRYQYRSQNKGASNSLPNGVYKVEHVAALEGETVKEQGAQSVQEILGPVQGGSTMCANSREDPVGQNSRSMRSSGKIQLFLSKWVCLSFSLKALRQTQEGGLLKRDCPSQRLDALSEWGELSST